MLVPPLGQEDPLAWEMAPHSSILAWKIPWAEEPRGLQSAAAKLHPSRPTLCDPIDRSPPGSPFPGILQARTLEWVAISSSNAWKWKVKVKSLSRVRLLATPRTAAHQAPPSMGFSRQESWSGMPLPSPGYSLGGRKELDTTERLSTHTSHLEVGIPSWIFLKSSLNASPFHPGPFWGLQGFPEPWEFVSLKWRWWPPPALVQALPLTCAHLGTSLWAKRPGKQTQDFRLTATHSPATSHS